MNDDDTQATGHGPLEHGFVSGNPDPAWQVHPSCTSARRYLDRERGGHLEVRAGIDGAGTGCYEWRHVPPEPHSPTIWVGHAPTVQQACLDADRHAAGCSI